MYNSAAIWLVIGFAGCVLLAFLLVVLSRIMKLRLPQRVCFVLMAIGMAWMLALVRLEKFGDEKQRQELKQVHTAAVTNVLLERAEQARAITNLEQIRLLFSGMQALNSLPAHHSHPIKMFDVSFRDNNRQFHYRIGQDSQNWDEYWVFRVHDDGTDGREIGRIQSAQLEPMLEGLLTNKP